MADNLVGVVLMPIFFLYPSSSWVPGKVRRGDWRDRLERGEERSED